MWKVILKGPIPIFSKVWERQPDFNVAVISGSIISKGRPLASVISNKYLDLIAKVDFFGRIPSESEDSEYAISSVANYVSNEVIEYLSKAKVIEQHISMHVFSNLMGGIQIELDGESIKADIEIDVDGNITLTKYAGASNTTSEYHLKVYTLFLISQYLNLDVEKYARTTV